MTLSPKRQKSLADVQREVKEDPINALSIISEANSIDCAYGWHQRRHQTQYVPVEIERLVPVTEYVDRVVPHPVPDPEVEKQLFKAQEELDLLRNAMVQPTNTEEKTAKDRFSLKIANDRLKAKISKRDEQISDLQAALLKNFGLAKELSDQLNPEVVAIQKEQTRLLQSKVVLLQEVLRNKEAYIQEITQAMIDTSTGVLKMQRETHEVLQAERLEHNAAWEEARRLERRVAELEKDAALISQLRRDINEKNASVEEMRQQLQDKDDVIEALEEQFRQSSYDEAANLTRDEVLVRMTQLRFKIGLKNAQSLKAKGELFKLKEKVNQQSNDILRLEKENEEHKTHEGKLRSRVESLKVQLANLRRDLLAASAPIRPIIMPQPIYDDERRLLEAPSAPRTRPLTEQDIIAAFSLFDGSIQGELPAWDIPMYLKCLGFTREDPCVALVVKEYRKAHNTLSLEEFRELVLKVQKDYGALKMSTESLLGQWQEVSKRRVAASKDSKRRLRTLGDSDSESEETEEQKHVASVSTRSVPMVSADIESAFALFDFDESGEIDQTFVGTLIHCLGLVRTTADLEALNVIISREFSGTLNLDEWTDLVQYCQGVQPNFIRRRVLEHKPPKSTVYPSRFPRAGRIHPLSEREIETAFRLFDVDRSGLLPGHQIPTYLCCLGLVCSGPEFTAMLVTQYKADLTQKVGFAYFCRTVRFVQERLDFFAPAPRPPAVRALGSTAERTRREAPIMAPQTTPLSAEKRNVTGRAPPGRPNTAAYSPRTRKPCEYPPWMLPAAIPPQIDPPTSPPIVSPEEIKTETPTPIEEDRRFAPPKEENDFTSERKSAVTSPRYLSQTDILSAFNFYAGLFNCPQVARVTGSKALALPHVLLAVRSLGFYGVTRRFLEQIWPFPRKQDSVKQQGGGAGEELVMDENEFLKLVKNIERYGTKRDIDRAGLPKRVNRHLAGGALRDCDIEWVFELLDDDCKSFLSAKDFRTLLTLIGFTLQDEPEIQNVLVTFDATRPSRSSREHNIFEFHDCMEVIRKLTAKPLTKNTNFNQSSAWLC